MKHSILYIVVIVIAILFTSCLGSKKTAIPEQVSTDPLSDNLGSAKGIDTGIVAQYVQLIRENRSLYDSLKNGKIEGTGTNIYFSYLDSVPLILYKLFPQVIFTKTNIPEVPSISDRRTGYYRNKQYNLALHFNILIKEMKYTISPSFKDYIQALILILENYKEPVNVKEVNQVEEIYERLQINYNYRVKADVNNIEEEYIIEYRNEQFLCILKISNNDIKLLEPLKK